MESLESKLREAFKIEYDKYGWQSVTTRSDAYNHVVLELAVFTLSEFDIQKMMDAYKSSGYSGFHITPRGERSSDARHYICFHK